MRKILGASVLALAALAAGSWLLVAKREAAARRALVADSAALRSIAHGVLALGQLPMANGVLDPYALVRKRLVDPSALRSQRLGGPTEGEIEGGDYRNFPWERYRGDRLLFDPEPFPLLWEREPDKEGLRLVALTDGSVVRWDERALSKALEEPGR